MVDLEFIHKFQASLERAKWTRQGEVLQCRCPICGDSQKNTRKTRGYFFRKEQAFFYKCQNCGIAHNMRGFLAAVFPDLLTEYKLATMKENSGSFGGWKLHEELPVQESPETTQNRSTIDLNVPSYVSVSDLPKTHQASVYVRNRNIPKSDRISYCPDFQKWVNDNFPDNVYEKLPNDKRILFPLKTESGIIFGVNARAIEDSGMRYVTIRFDDSHPKVYGMEFVNRTLPVFMTEGPIDSLFLPNAIAMVGGDVGEVINMLPNNIDKYWVGDNEPRSRDTVRRMSKAIDMGCKVCFWGIQEKFKDINDMVSVGGIPAREILEHIVENSFAGAKAKLALTKWKKF